MKIALLLVLLVGSAFADPITITLNNANQSGPVETTLNFTGTLTNTGNTELFINSDSFSIATLMGDDSAFLTNAPISLNAGETSSSFLMFTVGIPNLTAAGTYQGSFHVLGGATGNDFVDLGAIAISVTVTPEPSTWLLLAPALGALILGVGGRCNLGA